MYATRQRRLKHYSKCLVKEIAELAEEYDASIIIVKNLEGVREKHYNTKLIEHNCCIISDPTAELFED